MNIKTKLLLKMFDVLNKKAAALIALCVRLHYVRFFFFSVKIERICITKGKTIKKKGLVGYGRSPKIASDVFLCTDVTQKDSR